MNALREIQIADLDGCISDDRWRRPLLPPEGVIQHDSLYHQYHEGCFSDPAANLHEIHPERLVIIFTARPVRFREETLMWLHEVAYISPLYLLQRNDNDQRSSLVLKRDMLRELLNFNSYGVRREEIVSAIDDRADIVAMYRNEFGIDARIVRIGEEGR